MALTAGLLGHLHLIGAGTQTLFVVVLLVGLVWRARCRVGRASQIPFRGDAKFFLLVIVAAFALRFLDCFRAWGMSDPLWYHLTAARLWTEAGKISVVPENPYVLQARYWEYLYIWPFRLNLLKGQNGLIAVQLFAQMIHFVFGFCTSLLLIFEITKTKLKASTEASLITVLAAAAVPQLLWSSVMAKNDWGVTAWSLSAILFMPGIFSDIEENASPTSLLCCGFFLGLAFAAKFNTAFLLLSASIVSIVMLGPKRAWLAWRWILPSAAATTIPIVLRNTIFTGNPLFPELSGFFHSTLLSKSQLDLQALAYGSWITADELLTKLYNVAFHEGVLVVGLFLIVFLRRETRARFAPIACACLLSVVLFSLRGNEDSIRLLGPTLALSNAVVAACACELLTKRLAYFAAFGVALLAVGLFKVDYISAYFGLPPIIFVIPDLISAKNFSQQILEHSGGQAKAWIRENVAQGKVIATTGDNQLYYLPGYEVFPGNEYASFSNAALDAVTANGAHALLPILNSFHVDYILDTQHWSAEYWSFIGIPVAELAKEFPQAVVYDDGHARVIDVKKL